MKKLVLTIYEKCLRNFYKSVQKKASELPKTVNGGYEHEMGNDFDKYIRRHKGCSELLIIRCYFLPIRMKRMF